MICGGFDVQYAQDFAGHFDRYADIAGRIVSRRQVVRVPAYVADKLRFTGAHDPAVYAHEGITVKFLWQADGGNLSELISDLDSDSHNGIAAQSREGVSHLGADFPGVQ